MPILVHNADPRCGGANVAGGNMEMATVGRWMCPAEYEKMVATGCVQGGEGGVSRVAFPSDPTAHRAAPKGDMYVEFDVPAGTLMPGGTDAWRSIHGPNSPGGRLNANKGLPLPELPEGTQTSGS
ncbi:hypothetical protein [Actinocrispum wychmicini]|uniref:TreTu family toxin n=1 Tax=Actinocrispum wychmicini TaxID=1213861 RepID=UPI003C7ACB42